MKRRFWAVLFTAFLSTHAGAQAPQELSDEEALAKLRAFTKQTNMTLTPEQEQAWLQQQKAMRARMTSGLGALQLMRAAPQATAPAMPAMPAGAASAPLTSAAQSESELGARLAALPPRPAQLTVKDRRDGFDANGRGFVDPEGRIVQFAVDLNSGLVTYLVQSAGTYLIKVGRAGTDAPALTIATARSQGDDWEVVSSTGVRIVGNRLTPLQGAGFLISRDTSAFVYRPGKGIENIAVPNGYVVANFQRGDVLGTQHLLLERAPNKEITNSLRAMGAALGMNKNEAYALLNLKSGQMVPIDISDTGKEVTTLKNCTAKNRFVNVCSSKESRESLYENDGSQHGTHYFWRINWFSTPSGPIAIALENGFRNLVVQDLNGGKKVVAFTRPLGVGGFSAVQQENGSVKLTARLGFETQTIDDAAALLSIKPDMQTAAAAKPEAP